MKLKKAMRLYPIERVLEHRYSIGPKFICPSSEGLWWKSNSDMEQRTEKDAVAWLIKGAKKLSPIQIAMRKHKDIVEDKHPLRNTIWKFHGRSIRKDNFNINYPWVAEAEHFRSSFATEKEAVRWLLSGNRQ